MEKAPIRRHRRPWRYRRARSLLLGHPGGAWASPQQSQHVVRDEVRAQSLPGVLIGWEVERQWPRWFSPRSYSLGTITPAYRRMLTQVQGGVVGTARPFQWWWRCPQPRLPWSSSRRTRPRWCVTMGSPSLPSRRRPSALLLWAVFGCLLVTDSDQHWESEGGLRALEERRERSSNARPSPSRLGGGLLCGIGQRVSHPRRWPA